jgi:hypothetical protein
MASSSPKPLTAAGLDVPHSFAGIMDENDITLLDLSLEASLPSRVSTCQPIVLSNAIVRSNGVEILGVTIAEIDKLPGVRVYSAHRWSVSTDIPRSFLFAEIKEAATKTEVFLSSNSIIFADRINESNLPSTYEGPKSKSKNYIKFESSLMGKSVVMPSGVLTRGPGGEMVIFTDNLTVFIIDNQLNVLRSIQFTGTLPLFGYRAHLLSGKRLAFTCCFLNEEPPEFNLVTTDTEYKVVNIDHSNFNDDMLECHAGLEGSAPRDTFVLKSPEGYFCRVISEEAKSKNIVLFNQAEQAADLKIFYEEDVKETKEGAKAIRKIASYFTPKEPGDHTPVIIQCDGRIRGLADWRKRINEVYRTIYEAVPSFPPVLCEIFLNYLNLTAIKMENRIDPRLTEVKHKQAELEEQLKAAEEKRAGERPIPSISPFLRWGKKSNHQIHRKLMQWGLFKDNIMLKKRSYSLASGSSRQDYREWVEPELKHFRVK